MSVTEQDWANAEALATQYLRSEKHVTQPIQLRRFEATPFLIGAFWEDDGGYVLIYNGKVHTERGVTALPGFLNAVGETRLRALSVGLVEGILIALGADRPTPPDVGPQWSNEVASHRDLIPALVDKNGVLKYVVHFVQEDAPLPDELSGPPVFNSSKPASGPLILQRWSLQLYPVLPNLDWKLEERVKRTRSKP